VSWFHVDDKFHGHPKVIEADEAGIGAWTKLGSYCALHGNDGVLPGPAARQNATKKGLAAAVKAGLLVHDAQADTYRISGYLKCNPSAEKVASRREAWRARQDKHRGVTHADDETVTESEVGIVTRDSPSDTDTMSRVTPHARGACSGSGSGSGIAPADPDPPVGPPSGGNPEPGTLLDVGPPSPRAPKPRKGRASKPRTGPPEGWKPDETVYAAGAEVGLDRADVDFEVTKMFDRARGEGKSQYDWQATARNWMRNVPKFRGNGHARDPFDDPRSTLQKPAKEGEHKWKIGKTVQ